MSRYVLPELPYEYNALEPYISEEILKLHHDKHHSAYVKGANAALEKLEKARKGEIEVDIKAVLKELSFHVGGHILHTIFWNCMTPEKGEPSGVLAEKIKEEFGSVERFKDEFSKAANSVEGSGWAALMYCPLTGRLIIQQIEKHNVNLAPGLHILACIDVWEHAYYLQYKNDRASFVKNWWNVVNWNFIEERLKEAMK
ncbi:superoxide dismutase [Archaeoglobus veneficus]|uniref:Superoxide dismutase n=1 Tax=Archaeoglobus veneficus (strain DSM 11195 / SNP6) TaxID=693661 RepID=F2KQT8_ARCVS|nr:superoxide dismutase [Archaeoglobus veneficus]AEA46650.1 Manganese/iron superoxide dismutase [Archaeoglobus veneficus SNP6]